MRCIDEKVNDKCMLGKRQVHMKIMAMWIDGQIDSEQRIIVRAAEEIKKAFSE